MVGSVNCSPPGRQAWQLHATQRQVQAQTHNLEWLRLECAKKLQRKLQDPQLRAEIQASNSVGFLRPQAPSKPIQPAPSAEAASAAAAALAAVVGAHAALAGTYARAAVCAGPDASTGSHGKEADVENTSSRQNSNRSSTHGIGATQQKQPPVVPPLALEQLPAQAQRPKSLQELSQASRDVGRMGGTRVRSTSPARVNQRSPLQRRTAQGCSKSSSEKGLVRPGESKSTERLSLARDAVRLSVTQSQALRHDEVVAATSPSTSKRPSLGRVAATSPGTVRQTRNAAASSTTSGAAVQSLSPGRRDSRPRSPEIVDGRPRYAAPTASQVAHTRATAGRRISPARANDRGPATRRSYGGRVGGSSGASTTTQNSATATQAAVALRTIVPVQALESPAEEDFQASSQATNNNPSAPPGSVSRDVIVETAMPPDPAAGSGATDEPWGSALTAAAPASNTCTPSLPSVLMDTELSPTGERGALVAGTGAAVPEAARSPASAIDLHGGHSVAAPGDPMDVGPTIERLVQENAALRAAFDSANRRLSKLEDEKMRFMDEGIFDLVNSVCGSGPAQPGERSLSARQVGIQQFAIDAQQAEHDASGDGGVRSAEPQALAVPPWAELSPASAVSTTIRRNEEEKRSAELTDENEALREELARVSEVGEALEQQQQAAEDRMHLLEQERAWLYERVARLADSSDFCLDAGTGAGRESRSFATSDVAQVVSAQQGCSGGTAELEVRQRLEETNRSLRTELQDARQRQEELLVSVLEAEARCGAGTEALEEQHRLREALRAEAEAERRKLEAERQHREAAGKKLEELQREREDRDRIISNLDGQAQVLERQLRDTEARARDLAEENARLQAALSFAPDQGDPEDRTSEAPDAALEPVPEITKEYSQDECPLQQGANDVCMPEVADEAGAVPDKIELEDAW